MLPSEIDKKVIDMIKIMRESGAVVNYNILIAVAVGVITANDRTLLKENGGTIELGRKECESIFKQLNFVKRKSTPSKAISATGLLPEIGLTYHKSVNKAVNTYKIPAELIINTDQTTLLFVLISKYTMEEKGASRISIPGTALL